LALDNTIDNIFDRISSVTNNFRKIELFPKDEERNSNVSTKESNANKISFHIRANRKARIAAALK
jgi:hypothetical protein